MEWQVIAIVVGLGALVMGLAVYVLSRRTSFGKAPEEVPPVSSNAGSQLTWVGTVFFGLMVICWIGFTAWAIVAFDMSARRDNSFVIIVVASLVALVFAALYSFILEPRGIRLTKKPK